MFQCDKIEDLERQPSAGVVLGAFESDGHKKKHHKTGWCFRIFSMFPPKKSCHWDDSRSVTGFGDGESQIRRVLIFVHSSP